MDWVSIAFLCWGQNFTGIARAFFRHLLSTRFAAGACSLPWLWRNWPVFTDKNRVRMKILVYDIKGSRNDAKTERGDEMEMVKDRVIQCGPYVLDYGKKTLIMGILNVTPDSFSDGGKFLDPEKAVRHAREMVEQGADIIDVGGESTRPGHEPVSAEEEMERIIPVIEALAKEIQVPISVDTYKAKVAEAALKAGAHIINDIWGAKADPDMAKVAAQYDVPIILMHNRKEQKLPILIRDVMNDLFESIQIAKKAGVKRREHYPRSGNRFCERLIRKFGNDEKS